MNPVLLAVLLLSGLGLFLGIGLGVANHFMGVKEDPKVTALKGCLPGANCGACGFSGCAGYAEALAKSPNVRTNLCVVGGDAVSAQIAAILGTEAKATERRVARVRCRGTADACKRTADYVGVTTCRAAASYYNGGSACAYGCIGLGDCAAVCDVQAISVRQGVAAIDESLCVGCEKCARVCPKDRITVLPVRIPTVLCGNPEKGAATKAVCTAGCVGCKLCERACEVGAITVSDGLARIDKTKCVGCGKCAAACRFGVIRLHTENA
ncbi:MAG: RnfABCDGE type electron transport complex subunit B [Clostridia bacterium]|nr:RnfABCDGE type electron transport complex subunit B [Clostridia bacterium]